MKDHSTLQLCEDRKDCVTEHGIILGNPGIIGFGSSLITIVTFDTLGLTLQMLFSDIYGS